MNVGRYAKLASKQCDMSLSNDHFRFGMLYALDPTRCITLTNKALGQRTRIVYRLSRSIPCRKVNRILESGQTPHLGIPDFI